MKEPLGFANVIYNILLKANWLYDKPETWTAMLGGTEGIEVYVHPDVTKETLDAANTLVDVLSSDGVNVTLKMEAKNSPLRNIININIGTKT